MPELFCNTLQNSLQHTATLCNTLQHTATELQHTATHCQTMCCPDDNTTLQHTHCQHTRAVMSSRGHLDNNTYTATHCNSRCNSHEKESLQHTITHPDSSCNKCHLECLLDDVLKRTHTLNTLQQQTLLRQKHHHCNTLQQAQVRMSCR